MTFSPSEYISIGKFLTLHILDLSFSAKVIRFAAELRGPEARDWTADGMRCREKDQSYNTTTQTKTTTTKKKTRNNNNNDRGRSHPSA